MSPKTVMAPLSLLLMLLVSCGNSPEAPDSRPNILLILIDTIRADHLSSNGYHRNTTPVLDSLAASGCSFRSVQSQSSWTLPAMVSILTGLDPRSHRAGWYDGGFYGIDPSLPYLPHMLHTDGYRTAAFFNVIFMSEDFGFHRGFDHFDCQGFVGDASTRDAAGTVRDALAWFDSETDGSEPWFMAVHFFDPHLPYDPPSPWDTLFTDGSYNGACGPLWGGRDDVSDVNSGEVVLGEEDLVNLVGLYDGELAFTDQQTGTLISELHARGAMSGTVVLIVGDHGEEFMDHGEMGHGHTMYQEVLGVPLILAGDPVPEGLPSHTPVAQMDIVPTLLGLAGIDVPSEVPGIDLLSHAGSGPRAIPSSNLVWESYDLGAVRRGYAKTIGDPSAGTMTEYDLEDDPGEHSPLPPSPGLVDELELYWSTPPLCSPAAVPFVESMENTLRDLGYIR